MKIAVAGPVTLSMLGDLFPAETKLPATYSFPLIALLARKMRERGHEVAIVALSRDVRTTEFFRGDRIEAYVCPQRRPRWQMADFFRGERRVLAEAMRASRCDIIHAHWTYEFGAAAIATRMPHLITAHDTPYDVLRFARHPYWFERPLLGFPVIRHAKRMTAVSPWVARSLNRIRRREDVTVIPNGVPAEVFALNRPRKRAGAGPTVFAAVLNYWAGLKNGRRLVEAFAKVHARIGSDARLLLFGFDYGPDGPAARWACAHGVDAGIEFCGPVSHDVLLRTLAAEADILVHPSLHEAHSMAVVEAMAIGIPVIGGIHSGAIPWTLADGKAGMLVDVRSASAIAQGMLTLRDDGGLRERMSAEGRRLALSSYDLDQIVDRYLAWLGAGAPGMAA